jgi:hypothetical protein
MTFRELPLLLPFFFRAGLCQQTMFSMKMAVFWAVAPGSLIAMIMETPSTSETSVNFYQTTRRNNPENSHIHTRRRENFKSHNVQHCSESTILKIILIIYVPLDLSSRYWMPF